jgi:hypothetical protein
MSEINLEFKPEKEPAMEPIKTVADARSNNDSQTCVHYERLEKGTARQSTGTGFRATNGAKRYKTT